MYSLNFLVTYVATPGSFSNVSIVQSNTEINSLTNYIFTFSNNDQILSGSLLKIKFPVEISVANSIRAPCTQIILGLSSGSQCEVISNSILNIYNAFPSNLASNNNISFSLNNITNHFCAEQSSSFTIKSDTSDNYSIDVINSGVFVNFTEGALIFPQILPKNTINYQVTTYTVLFQNKNILRINSQIVITFPATDVILANVNDLQTNSEIEVYSISNILQNSIFL